jgi:ABC-type polar amino acid transport system ATPase subunit
MNGQAIAVRGLHLSRGSRHILSGVDLEVTRGEVVALMGASGSGKTTVLRVLAGLESFESGTVDVEGAVVAQGSPPPDSIGRLRQKVGMVFQFHCLFEHLPALQNVTLALLHVHRTPRAPVLLMDEPTASLDPSRRMELASLVRSLAERPRTLLVATHDEDFAAAAATRVLHMRDGRITAGSEAVNQSVGLP